VVPQWFSKFQERQIVLFKGTLQYYESSITNKDGNNVFPFGEKMKGWIDLADYAVLTDVASEDGKLTTDPSDILLHYCTPSAHGDKKGIPTMSRHDILSGKGDKDLLLRSVFIEKKMGIVGHIAAHAKWRQKYEEVIDYNSIMQEWSELLVSKGFKPDEWKQKVFAKTYFGSKPRFAASTADPEVK